MVQGGIVTFTTLTPASDPCTGNTVGRMYDLDFATGGRVVRGAGAVYDIDSNHVIDSSDKFSVAGLGPGLVAPSGKQLIGGASETPLRLRLPEGMGAGGTSGGGSGGGGSGGGGGTITNTGACTDFVPGWGCMANMGRKPLGGSFMDFVSNQKLEGSGLLPGGNNIDTTLKSIPALSGRVTWREIMR
jgi:Tfp pilus tip-associated adhesin PilY1